MNLGEVFTMATQKDLASNGVNNGLLYSELLKDGRLEIKMSSTKHPEATIECSIPFNGSPEEENYLRLYFLSMVFNSAVHGMKRFKHKKNKK